MDLFQLGPLNSSTTTSTGELLAFKVIEDQPTLGSYHATIYAVVASITLVTGVAINLRILSMLWKRRSNGGSAAIDKLFLANNIVSLLGHPPLLVYVIARAFFFPMVNYIGIFGCGFFMLFLDYFIRLHSLFLPLAIAIMRYIFVVQSQWLKTRGVIKVVDVLLALCILIPIAITFSLQFPIFDFPQGPFNHCIGRFEVYFDPKHPDPFTPGRRGGKGTCEYTFDWVYEPEISFELFLLRFLLLLCCIASKWFFYIVTLSLPELILYPITFRHIIQLTNTTASTGTLRSEAIKRRKQQNTLNIYLTFWAWLAQFLTNMFNLVLIQAFFGKNIFIHAICALLHLTLNFNVLPFFYVVFADENIKTAIYYKEYKEVIKLFLTFR